MSGRTGSSAELQKLAHALDLPPSRLAVVADLPDEDLRTLRLQVSDALFEADKPAFVRVAALSKAVPGAVAAKLTQAVLPPIIAARVAELLDPDRAADMVGRLSDDYVAEVAMRMDAARAPHVVEAIPPAKIGAIARELARREEWVVIGGFVSAVSSPALAASVAEFSGEQLLRIGFVLDDRRRFDEIGDLLTDTQVDDLLAAAARAGLWAELEVLASHLTGARRARFAARFAEAPAAVRAAFDAAVSDGVLAAATLAG